MQNRLTLTVPIVIKCAETLHLLHLRQETTLISLLILFQFSCGFLDGGRHNQDYIVIVVVRPFTLRCYIATSWRDSRIAVLRLAIVIPCQSCDEFLLAGLILFVSVQSPALIIRFLFFC